MGDLLADLLNNRIEPVPTRGQVNGVMDYGVSDDEDDDVWDSEDDSDTEQQEYVQKEFETYFPRQQVKQLRERVFGGFWYDWLTRSTCIFIFFLINCGPKK